MGKRAVDEIGWQDELGMTNRRDTMERRDRSANSMAKPLSIAGEAANSLHPMRGVGKPTAHRCP